MSADQRRRTLGRGLSALFGEETQDLAALDRGLGARVADQRRKAATEPRPVSLIRHRHVSAAPPRIAPSPPSPAGGQGARGRARKLSSRAVP